jgi:glycine dehydrogenase subunit 1
VSQGTLQTIFEFQSMLCALTGLDVSNASLYDGATATVEALFMAQRVTRRQRLIVADTVHPEYLETLRTYIRNIDVELGIVGHGPDGRVDLDALPREVDERVAAVAVQSPNALGVVERLDRVASIASGAGAAAVGLVAEPYSLGMLKGPGELGCDICAGEAQGFGNGLSFGGPYLGFLAAGDRYLRQMPGRIAGETTDVEGRRGFVLTLSTREQHIRREKATSNICTNQGLCMTAATIQMALLGKSGLAEVADINHRLAAYAIDRLTGIRGVSRAFSGPYFNEFALALPAPASQVVEALLERGIVAGMDLGRWYPDMERTLLVAVTERTTKEDVDEFARALGEVL